MNGWNERSSGPRGLFWVWWRISRCHFGGGLPQIVPHTVVDGAPFCLARDLQVTPLEVIHGRLPVVAYRFNDFAYATDLSEIPPATMENLRDLKVLVLDCLRIRPHSTHLWLERALEYIGPDEYVEATPKNLRLRKKILDENQRKRAQQSRSIKVVAE